MTAPALERAADPALLPAPLLRLVARERATPLGAILAGLSLGVGLLVGLLKLDRLSVTICTLKATTGLACPTCGGTRALGLLYHFDLSGALAMNPLVTVGVLALIPWALADLWYLRRGRALELELSPRGSVLFGVGAGLALLINWIYLIAVGR
jgi:predicted ABC-type sugar transport system permease subunit